MRTIWTVVLAGACLGGCSWVEAFRPPPPPAPTPEQTSVSDDAKCQSYGTAPGTQPYFQCRLAIDQQREQSSGGLASAATPQPAAPPTIRSPMTYGAQIR
jgi:hypothetical protein